MTTTGITCFILHSAVCRKSAVNGDNRTRYESACFVVGKPQQTTDKVAYFAEFFIGVAFRILPVLAVGVPSALNKSALF